MSDGELSENELWMASFYRSSEMSGAMFFGRVYAQAMTEYEQRFAANQ